MKNKIILHIPHSSLHIPGMEGYVVDKDYLLAEMLKLTDWYTDDLFHSAGDEMIVAGFSRIYCDPERFTDDKEEVMAKYGMGVLYEKDDEGNMIRNVSVELKEKILNDYYWPHHNKLTSAVDHQLNFFGKALILDCHSFPAMPLKRDLDQNPVRPDFNIGTDPCHTPQKLVDLSVEFFKNAGYSLGIDWPYKGSIVPLKYYQKEKNIQSIMLEINRNLYLKEGSSEKSGNYQEIKKITGDFIQMLRSYLVN